MSRAESQTRRILDWIGNQLIPRRPQMVISCARAMFPFLDRTPCVAPSSSSPPKFPFLASSLSLWFSLYRFPPSISPPSPSPSLSPPLCSPYLRISALLPSHPSPPPNLLLSP